MKDMKRSVVLLLLGLTIISGFQFARNPSHSPISQCKFKKGDDEKGEKRSFFDGLKRFIPGIVRARFEKTYAVTQSDTGNRYQVRLKNPVATDRRHIVTRIQRFFPGTAWETADSIVKQGLEEGFSVIRIYNSKDDAKYAMDMMRLADPPIGVEMFDTKQGEIVSKVILKVEGLNLRSNARVLMFTNILKKLPRVHTIIVALNLRLIL
eukprot:gene3252-6434_t